jgi:hypothetical protein
MRLEPAEAALLSTLIGQLEEVLAKGDADDDVYRRLFPSGYLDDAQAETDFRTLTESGLRAERDERLAACRADVERGGDVELGDPSVSRRWLQVLNDLRLALGTRLGVSEDDDHVVDPSAPDAEPRSIYYWLTYLQDSLITAVSR